MANVPKVIYTGGGADEIKITATTFPGVKIMPTEIVNFTTPYLATVSFVVECRVTGGYDLKARISRTNPGAYPMLDSTAVLTTNSKYEMHCHMSGFRIDPGNHELYLECCVSGGIGYVRYRYFSMIFSDL
ncbi:MAG TPA: hypothetical protein VMC09_09925 [Anaerolineales bacterium]|nr:hypothetical protein [Anaerolineales bacterium]